MKAERCSVVFLGEIIDNYTIEQVKTNISQRYRKDDQTIEALFSGRTITLRKNLSKKEAEKFVKSLADIGAIAHIKIQQSGLTIPENINGQFSQYTIPGVIQEAKPKQPVKMPIHNLKDSSDTPNKDDQIKFIHRLKYYLDNFLAKGGSSIFKGLLLVFIASFFLIAGARGLLQIIYPEAALQYKELDFLGNTFLTFLQLTDPGNMAQDMFSSPWYKFFSILAGLFGLIMLSALIAFITTALDQKINELKRGRSKVIESGHTIILGWNEQRIIEILRELIIANESEKDACVVILADIDKEEMDDVLRLRLSDCKTTRIVTRHGRISTIANLEMVSISQCKSVIILAGCDDIDSKEEKILSDTMAIQTILATTQKLSDKKECSVVAEIFNDSHREIIETTFHEHIVTINTGDILAKLLVQTSRSTGLSIVYNEILSFDGCEMYFYHDNWGDITFKNLAFHFPDGVPIGIRSSDGDIILNPPIEYRLKTDDNILIIANDDSTIKFLPKPVSIPNDLPLFERSLSQRVERELILGWNHKVPIILGEFSDYVKEGSQIHIMLNKPSDATRNEIKMLNNNLKSIDISLVEKNCLYREDLLSVKPFDYNNIIILAGEEQDGKNTDAQKVDSENIVALLLLRNIFNEFAKKSKNTKLIAEVLDSQSHPLVTRAGVKDIIISSSLISMIIAQISENKDVKKVYDNIFQEEGSEIYLKPASLYFNHFPINVSFADIMAVVQKRSEICIGVKIKSLEFDIAQNNGIKLIPEKNTIFNLNPEDSLVVLAENEL